MGNIPHKPPSQLKALYLQWFFETRAIVGLLLWLLFETNDYGMTSCPTARTAENEDRYEGLILSEHEK